MTDDSLWLDQQACAQLGALKLELAQGAGTVEEVGLEAHGLVIPVARRAESEGGSENSGAGCTAYNEPQAQM